jgi:non-ribosomal peptide synthetase-like protein
LRGLRIGKQTFDDGCSFPEPTLVQLGDSCCLNAESIVQAHSLEDGTFKSDRVIIGNHCTLGAGAFVHYGCNVQDDAILFNDSFLMNGSTMVQGSVWGGNPAESCRQVVQRLVYPGRR